jgi:hypothetical protein
MKKMTADWLKEGNVWFSPTAMNLTNEGFDYLA